MSRQFLATSAPAISSLQVAFRLDFEFSKSVFLHHLEIQLTAGRSGPCPLPLPPCLLLLALLCCWEHPPPTNSIPYCLSLGGPWVSTQVLVNLLHCHQSSFLGSLAISDITLTCL